MLTLFKVPFLQRVEFLVERRHKVEHQRVRVNERPVPRSRQRLRNPPRRLNSLELDVGRTHGFADEFGGEGFTLGADDDAFLVLDGLLDEELGTFCVLLGGLLGFRGLVELLREREVHLMLALVAYY